MVAISWKIYKKGQYDLYNGLIRLISYKAYNNNSQLYLLLPIITAISYQDHDLISIVDNIKC